MDTLDFVDLTDLYQAVVVWIIPVETGFTYEYEILRVGEDEGDSVGESTEIFPTANEAIEAGINEGFRDCAVSQLFDLLYDWSDLGLITAEEFAAADSALLGGDRG